jgi:hypothetical protein
MFAKIKYALKMDNNTLKLEEILSNNQRINMNYNSIILVVFNGFSFGFSRSFGF